MSDDRKEVLKIFEQLKKKYKLEPLEFYEEEFFFYLDKPSPLVWEVVSFVMKRISMMKGLISIAYSPQGFIEGYESKFVSTERKEELFPVLKRIVALEWESVELFTKGEEARIAFLKKAVSMWKELKPVMQRFTNEMSSKWLEEEKKGKHDSYIS